MTPKLFQANSNIIIGYAYEIYCKFLMICKIICCRWVTRLRIVSTNANISLFLGLKAAIHLLPTSPNKTLQFINTF